MNFLNKNEQLLKALRSGSKVSEGSQTAFLTQTKRLGQEFIAFTVALATGHYTIATGFLLDFGIEWGGPKLLTSRIGKKFLTKGITIPRSLKMLRVPFYGQSIQQSNQ